MTAACVQEASSSVVSNRRLRVFSRPFISLLLRLPDIRLDMDKMSARVGTRPAAIQARFRRSWPIISFLISLSVAAWLAALGAFCSSASRGGGVERVILIAFGGWFEATASSTASAFVCCVVSILPRLVGGVWGACTRSRTRAGKVTDLSLADG